MAYKDVWRGEMPLRRAEGKIYEYACHEGNYSMANILAGAREEEKRREKEEKKRRREVKEN